MKIYDISQEVFSCQVFPGDRAPAKIEDLKMSRGDFINLTSFEMCAHNGTHIDAPYHFFENGDTVEKIPLEKTVGYCYVTEQNEEISDKCALAIIENAKVINAECVKRILIKGRGVICEKAAKIFSENGVWLIGVESQTVGPEDAPAAVHEILLGAKIVLLEGVRLSNVNEGVYFLSAAPLNLGGSDGAPCRAVLIKE